MSVNPVKISVVSYLNSTPFMFGLKNYPFQNDIKISEDIPSVCAEKLISGNADIGLIPVAALLDLKDHRIISNYCIGADGAVKSVLLLSDVPLQEIKSILLDYQSRTSVLLTRILADKFWKIKPEWIKTDSGYENKISNEQAGVVIGDRALLLRKNYKYVYDLAEEWKTFTGLPFAFACWTSVRKLTDVFIKEFNSALKLGLSSIDKVVKDEGSNIFSEKEIYDYLTKSISFDYDTPKQKALELFLNFAREQEQQAAKY